MESVNCTALAWVAVGMDGIDTTRVIVKLNGVEQRLCTAANTSEGWVDRYQEPQPLGAPMPVVERVHGHVDIWYAP